ncbi:AfsR/SARP family transcriptional regulator [Streptomyces aureoverticillatus]|uniref:AfsR/SARP family transcriptional regulator n=1 Tax=Streptomyces aureoverticillatus TaxID=66871 RepID=UPI0013DD17E1|nr:AfsR/SARP family transcriptional regulator [Streptomyces aureoverticillatus]QIB47740.1 AfsR family transcriptional regulator [Streptomyces aureoverticillatus]
MHGDDLQYALLGPARVRLGDVAIPLTPQQQAILAILLGRRGRAVTVGELIDGLWGPDAPNGARSTLQTQVGQLRGKLEPGRPPRTAARVLRSVQGAYLLETADGANDVELFERYAADAGHAERAGDTDRAYKLLDAALQLWRGQPLAGVPGPYAESLRASLAEARLAALETRLRLGLDRGAHADVLPRLTALVAEHPLREGLQALLMLALHQDGRQSEALAVYREVRRLLDDELGVSPGAELTTLHQRILRADPALAPGPVRPATATGAAPMASASPHSPSPHPPIPAQLPAPPSDFTGRTEEEDRLLAALDAEAPRVVVSAVAGIGGVGKTTLALHAGRRVRARYPDGQLYADLLGASASPAEPAEILARFLRALDAGPVPDGVEERAALYRSALAGRRVLVVLDDAAAEAQLMPLLPSTPGCAALITSRARLGALPAAHILDLDVLTPDDALDLLTLVIGPERIAAEPRPAAALVAACGRLPLAVRIVGARLVQRPSWTLDSMVRRLADERRRLGQLRVGDLAVEATFRLSYDQLPPELARAFRLTALADGPTFAVPAAAALLDLDEEETESLLERLVAIGLLESPYECRYRFHDLLQLFARARADQSETAAERDAAHARLIDHYLATARDAYRLARPGCTLPDALTATHRTAIPFSDSLAAQEWVREEIDAILGALRHAAGTPGTPETPAGAPSAPGTRHTAPDARLRAAADLLLVLDPFSEHDFLWPRLNGPAAALADAAAAYGEFTAEIRARYMLAGGLWQVGDETQGTPHVERALSLCRATGDESLLGQLLNVSALLTENLESEQALALFRESSAVHIRRGNLWGELEALVNTCTPLRALGRGTEALAALRDALPRAAPMGWTLIHVYLQCTHADTLAGLGRAAEAFESYGVALTGSREIGSDFLEAMVERGLGMTAYTLGRSSDARLHLERCLDRARALGHQRLQVSALTGLGEALAALGDTDHADAYRHEAHGICERLGIAPPAAPRQPSPTG